MITVGIPTIHADGDLIECIQSICDQTLPVSEIIILDNSEKTLAIENYKRIQGHLENFLHAYDIQITYILTYGSDSGSFSVAESWNYFARNTPLSNMLLVLNDDVVLGDTAVETLYKAWNKFSDAPVLLPDTGDWCVFVWNTKIALTSIGLFDTAFYPAYWEDCDYAYRIRLTGLEPKCIDGVLYTHKGSQTIKKYESTGVDMESKHHQHFRRNREYFRRKWGTVDPSTLSNLRPFQG